MATYKEPTAKDVRDSIMPIVVKAPARSQELETKPALPFLGTSQPSQASSNSRSDCGNHSSFSQSAAPQSLFTPEERVKFTFSGSKDFAAMVEKAQRSVARDKAKREKPTQGVQVEERNEIADSVSSPKPSRYIPASVCAEVMLRDGAQCTYNS